MFYCMFYFTCDRSLNRLKLGAETSKWFGASVRTLRARVRNVRTLRHQFCGAEVSCGRSVRLPFSGHVGLVLRTDDY